MGHFTLERTFYTSVECPPEALRTSVDCPGGHFAQGDILHSDTGTGLYLNDLTVTMSLTKSAAEEVEQKSKQDSKRYQDAKHKAKETPLKIGDPVLCFEPNLKKGL